YNYFSPAELNDPARSGRLADPDQDGYPNILEFALNTDPLDSGSRPTPVLEQSEVGISLTFVRPRLALDVAYMVETSTDLLEWTQAVPPLTIVSETDETTTMCLSLPFAEDG